MKKIIVLLFVSFAFIYSTHATHLRAGQITVKQQPGSRTCQITITVFTNTSNTTVLFGGEQDYLTFGDGTLVLVPETYNTFTPDLGPSVGIASFTTSHTYSSFGSYLIGYREPNRNAGIINMDASVNTQFYIESFISIAENGPPYETPVLLMEQPVLTSAFQSNYTESIACMDVNNNQLYYELVTPQSDTNTDVLNYVLPENFSINPVSGLLTWDTKFRGAHLSGEFAFAVRINQIKGNKIVGYMLRDFQLILVEGVTEGLFLDGGAQGNKRVFVPEGTATKLRIAAGGVGAGDMTLEVKSELDKFPQNFSYTIEDSTHEEMHYTVAKITVMNTPEIIRNNPYIISVRGVFRDIHNGRIAKDLTYIIATRDIEVDHPLPPVSIIEDGAPYVGISVAPNPVADFLEISNKNNATVNVRIYDLTGRVWQQQTIDTSTSIDLRPLTAGPYLCVLVRGDKITSYKIVKK